MEMDRSYVTKKEKWTKFITEWYPRDYKRSQGRQIKRWENDIKEVAGPKWMKKAKHKEKWMSLQEAFVEGQIVQNFFIVSSDYVGNFANIKCEGQNIEQKVTTKPRIDHNCHVRDSNSQHSSTVVTARQLL